MNGDVSTPKRDPAQIPLHYADQQEIPHYGWGPDGRRVDVSSDQRFFALVKEWQDDACKHPRTVVMHWRDMGGNDKYQFCCVDCGARKPHWLKIVDAQRIGVAVDFTKERADFISRNYERARDERLVAICKAAADRVMAASAPSSGPIGNIRAIETRYKGYRFRSRLEARWAVFFDHIQLPWTYELEGYDLGEHGWYLPDFFLPTLGGGTWVEVKPEGTTTQHPDAKKWQSVAAGTGHNLLLADGCPALKSYLLFHDGEWRETCFAMKYLPPRNHDFEPRLFWAPGGEEDCDAIDAVHAARAARFETSGASI